MTWTTHPTVAFQQLWSYTNQNTYVKGNLDFLAQHPSILLWPGGTAYAPLSGLTAAGIEVVESSGAGTVKPIIPQIRFDASTDEGRMWLFVMPRDYVQDLTLRGVYRMASANTSASVVLVAQLAAVSDGDSSMSAKVFDAANSTTISVPDAADEADVFSIVLSNADGVTAGDWCCLVLYRDANNASDTASGDLILVGLELQYDYD